MIDPAVLSAFVKGSAAPDLSNVAKLPCLESIQGAYKERNSGTWGGCPVTEGGSQSIQTLSGTYQQNVYSHTHLIVINNIVNECMKTISITTTVLHGPVYVSLGASTCGQQYNYI